MSLREIGVASVWVASAIGVAGWTWQSYTQQRQAFPTPGSSGGGGGGTFNTTGNLFQPPDNAAKKIQSSDPLRKVPGLGILDRAGTSIGNAISNVFGIGGGSK